MTVEKKEKLTIKKPVVKKAEATKTTAKKITLKKTDKATKDAKEVKETKKAATKNVEVKEISENQVKMVRKVKSEKSKSDNLDRTYATGKRKNAVARVWIKKGTGSISINKVGADEYLKRPILEVVINTPFAVTETEGKFDVICTVCGGGLSGQAGAIKHGIAKALNLLNPEAYRKSLKSVGLLTRDSRVVERKKAGLKKARKGQVFSKR